MKLSIYNSKLKMLSKLRDLTKFNKRDKIGFNTSTIKSDLCNGLFKVMENSFNQRKQDSTNSNLSPSDVDNIIKQYAQKNSILAAASSIIPGPFGILSSIPELLLNFNNQMNMIYDLGCAYGKEDFINRDILLDIPIAAFGGNTNLSLIQNNKANLSDSSKKILIEKATVLGESIMERTLKKSIVQFIPVAGPILMGTWAKMATAKISNGSIAFLDNFSNYSEHIKPKETDKIKQELLIEKIKGLANLIESNDEINVNQIELIGTIIENATLTKTQKEYYLEQSLKTGSNFQLNYQLLKDYEEEEDLIMELVIMAKRSGNIDQLEKNYIYQIGKELELDKGFIDQLFH